MSRTLLSVGFLLCQVGWPGLAAARDAGRPEETGDATAADDLRGTWKVVRVELPGKNRDVGPDQEEVLTFDRGQLSHKAGFTTSTSSYRIENMRGRQELEMSRTNVGDPRVLAVTRVIYRVDGDTLRLAYSLTRLGKELPASFEGPDVYVVVLKRMK
jgi:uncharacterized protein (TIGR03067 family)